MAANRLSIGFSEEENAALTELAQAHNCTKQEIIKRAVSRHRVDMKPLIEEYWRKREKEHAKEYLECTLDSPTLHLLENFARQMHNQFLSLEAVKKQINSLLRDMDKVKTGNTRKLENMESTLDALESEIYYLLNRQELLEKSHGELMDDVQHVSFRLKRVYGNSRNTIS